MSEFFTGAYRALAETVTASARRKVVVLALYSPSVTPSWSVRAQGDSQVKSTPSWYPRDRRRKVRNWAVETALEAPKVVELTPLVYPLL